MKSEVLFPQGAVIGLSDTAPRTSSRARQRKLLHTLAGDVPIQRRLTVRSVNLSDSSYLHSASVHAPPDNSAGV